jgi:hypothetical protein
VLQQIAKLFFQNDNVFLSWKVLLSDFYHSGLGEMFAGSGEAYRAKFKLSVAGTEPALRIFWRTHSLIAAVIVLSQGSLARVP